MSNEGPSEYDTFVDRVLDAQRHIARYSGLPYNYTVYINPAMLARLDGKLGRVVVPVVADASLADGEIVLRHEVRA